MGRILGSPSPPAVISVLPVPSRIAIAVGVGHRYDDWLGIRRVSAMKQTLPPSRMSTTDAAFLYIERETVPLHIASVCIFDGPIPFKQFVASIDSKLHLVPRYRQIPHEPTWDLDFPVWQDDPSFDIHRHVIPVTLPAPGGDAELQSLSSRILSQLLDRKKPLWDIHVVSGLAGGRGALIWRLHHALADGVSGAQLMRLFLESTPDVPASFPKRQYSKVRRRVAESPPPTGVYGMLHSILGRLLEFEAGLLTITEALLGHSKSDAREAKENPLRGLIGLLPEFTASIERLPFNKPCTGERKFCWAEFDLAAVQRIREAAGGTINDVYLAIVTRALAHYVKLHGESVVNRLVRIVCPVNLRVPDEQTRGGLGNQISFLPIALPLDSHGPIRTLQAVTERTEALKQCGVFALVGLAAKWLAAFPPPLQAFFWRNIPEVILPVPLLNMICTNVVGSSTPLYAVGRRMVASYPQVPTGWELGVGCAAHSYDGKLYLGLIADTHAAPDVERLRDFMVESFHELCRGTAHRKARSIHNTVRPRRRHQQQPANAVSPVAAESPSEGARREAEAATGDAHEAA